MNRSCVEVDLSGFEQLDADGKPNKAGMIEGLEGPYPFAMKWVWNQTRTGVIKNAETLVTIANNAKYLRERDPRSCSLASTAATANSVYHFRKGLDKVFAPAGGDPFLSAPGKCPFFGMHHCVSKSDDVLADQAPTLPPARRRYPSCAVSLQVLPRRI